MKKTLEDFHKLYAIPHVKKNLYKNELMELMEVIFEAEPNLLMILFKGYTPSWNDGDVCEHYEFNPVFLTTSGVSDFEILERYIDQVATSAYHPEEAILVNEFMGVKLATPIPSNVFDEKITISEKIKDIVEGQDLIRNIYDTDYLVKIYKTSEGSVKIEMEDSYCDY